MDSYQINWKRCKRCGSYIPSGWNRCGHCGKPLKHNMGLRGIAVLLVFAVMTYFYMDEILSFINRTTGQADPDKPQNIVSETESNSADDIIKYENIIEPVVTNTPAPSDQEEAEPLPDASSENTCDIIRNALLSGDDSVKISPLSDSDQVFDIIEEIILREPEIMFYKGCVYRTDGLLRFNYHKSPEFIEKARSEVKRKAGEIISSIIKKDMSDYEKELAIHDYIINNCRYDIESLEKNNIPPESYSVYGVLVKGVAVCEGYAKTMKLLCDMAGLESLVVTGKSKGQLHAWNLVKLDGSWYHLDATWDDPVSEDGRETLKHTYFNLTDREIQTDHVWNEGDYPKCNETRYGYYTYNKWIVSSESELIKYLMGRANKGYTYLTVKISDYSAKIYDIPSIIENMVNLTGKNASYSINESYGVLDVWIGI